MLHMVDKTTSTICTIMCFHAHLLYNNNNNNNNNRIYVAPYGRNFRGAGGRLGQCSVEAWVNKKSFKSWFKNRQRVTDQNCLWQRVPDRWCWKSESTDLYVTAMLVTECTLFTTRLSGLPISSWTVLRQWVIPVLSWMTVCHIWSSGKVPKVGEVLGKFAKCHRQVVKFYHVVV